MLFGAANGGTTLDLAPRRATGVAESSSGRARMSRTVPQRILPAPRIPQKLRLAFTQGRAPLIRVRHVLDTGESERTMRVVRRMDRVLGRAARARGTSLGPRGEARRQGSRRAPRF